MNEIIYNCLIKLARSHETISYSNISALIRLDMSNPDHRQTISCILDEISTHEHNHGHPLLSVLVVLANGNRPGAGFFNLARELGYNIPDETAFFENEISRVCNFWATTDNEI